LVQTATDLFNVAQVIANTPKELRETPQWIYWRGEERIDQRPGEVKLTKPPIDPKTLVKADKTDPRIWGTFEDCCRGIDRALEGWKEEDPDAYRGGGLGFVFTENDPYAGIDLDHCRNPETGDIEPWAKQIIAVLHSYTEISPSGTGVHIYVKGQLAGTGQNKQPIELYDRKAYFTVTGDHLPETPTTIEDRQTVVEWLYDAMPILAKLLADSGKREKVSRLFAGDISDYGHNDSSADMGLCSLAAHIGATAEQIDALMRLSGLMRPKWDEMHGVQTYGQMTIAKALEGQSGSTAKEHQRSVPRVQVYSAHELTSKALPPVRWVVPGLIPEGLTLLAGDAKIGKSWAVLGMGLAVATGERVFGYFDVEPGDVLYFALEDSPQRLQVRLDILAQGWTLPDNFHLVCQCPQMPDFEQTLEELMQDYPETQLISVDVLARVQKRQRSGNRNAYLEDYDSVTPLQRFALDHHIALVGVTHTNQKEVVTDKFHKITGTTGIIGCADTLLLLQRDRPEASGVLSVTGRDVGDAVYKAEFHNGIWVVQGEQAAPQPGPEPFARAEAQKFLRSFLADGRHPSTEVQEAAKATGISEKTLRRAQESLGITPKKDGKVWYWALPVVHRGEEWDKTLDERAA
jgi:AAA domain/NrS-1  polymerase HBD domain